MLVIFYTFKQSNCYFKLDFLQRLLRVSMHIQKPMNDPLKSVVCFASSLIRIVSVVCIHVKYLSL